MIIAGPNVTVDRTMDIDELRPGQVLRCSSVHVTAGGKGVNVARAARSLEAAALLIGLAPGATGRAVADMIAAERLAFVAVEAPGEIRSTAIVLERSGRVTVLNEPGPNLPAERWRAYEDAVALRLPAHGILVCSGSLPPGSPADAYGRLVRLARAHGRRSLVDASGSTLRAALEAGPDFVVPNLGEAEQLLFGAPEEEVHVNGADVQRRATTAATALVDLGARVAIVTAAAAGAAVAAGTRSWWISAPRVQVSNPIGAGDSFTAGLAAAVEHGDDLVDAVALGIGCGAASVETPGAGDVDAARVRQLALRARTTLRVVSDGHEPR